MEISSEQKYYYIIINTKYEYNIESDLSMKGLHQNVKLFYNT